jgi:hypothetical protein
MVMLFQKISLHWGKVISCVVVLLLLYLIPVSTILNGSCICIVKNITGLECPGCGLTRSFFYCLHGDFSNAIQMNWRCIIVFPVLSCIALRLLIKKIE